MPIIPIGVTLNESNENIFEKVLLNEKKTVDFQCTNALEHYGETIATLMKAHVMIEKSFQSLIEEFLRVFLSVMEHCVI